MENFFIHWFFYPFFLICWILGILFYLWIIFIFKKEKNFWNLSILQKVYKKNSALWKIYSVLLVLISFLFLFILSWPYSDTSVETRPKNGIDIQIVLDVSNSMNTPDIFPSRIEASKNSIVNFLDSRTADRVGVLVFAGKPFYSVPLSFDYEFLREFISDINTSIVNQWVKGLNGTAIWEAIILASDSFIQEEDKDRSKIIILFTDWKPSWQVLDPSVASLYAKDLGIKIYSVWMWSNNPWNSGIDEKLLEKISLQTWWKYYKAEDAWDLWEIVRDISLLEKTDIKQEYFSFKKIQIWWAVLLLIICFLMLFYIRFFKKIKV